MNLFNRIKSALIRKISLREPHNWMGNSGISDSGEVVNAETALGLSAVWGCINLIAGTTGSLPLMVYKTDRNGERQVARDHSLFRLLHDSPNFDQTAVDFWEYVSASIELWGNAFAVIEKSGNKITAIFPISPAIMNVRRKSNGSIEYSWTEGGKSFVETDEKIFHVRGFGGNPLGGLSTLHYARNSFGLARALEKSASKTFVNGLRPSGVLTFQDWLSAENRNIAKNELVDQFSGSENTGRPMILEGGTKWEALNITPEDAQMLESRKFSVEDICRFFQVPPSLIGHTEKSSSFGTGLEEITLGFQKFTLRRRLKRIEQAVSKQLLTTADRSAGVTVEFNIEGLLRGDSKSRSSYYKEMTSIGVMTINEVRRLENMPPVEGGDQPRMQMQNVPITQSDQLSLEN